MPIEVYFVVYGFGLSIIYLIFDLRNSRKSPK